MLGPQRPTTPSPPVSGNSLSPVMIPPPRHLSSDNVPLSPHIAVDSFLPVGSYNASEFSSPTTTEGFSEDNFSKDTGWVLNENSGKAAVKQNTHPASGLTPAVTNEWPHMEVQKEQPPASSMPKKEKTTKAERRALQDAQRTAKAAANVVNSANANTKKVAKAPPQKKDSVAASEKRGGDRQTDKDRKKDAPHPCMQFDDEDRVEKAKKRSVVKQTESRNRVELFRHLPQYEHGTRLVDLESKFFQLDTVHPAIYMVGLRFLTGDISGGNARCIAMLRAFQESIKDYSTPLEKELARDLPTKINGYVSFLIQCRPLSISMGNAISFLKPKIPELPSTMSELEANASLLSDIDRFINEKIILAEK